MVRIPSGEIDDSNINGFVYFFWRGTKIQSERTG